MLLALCIILVVLLALLTYLLCAPLLLEIDSPDGFIQLRFHRLASVRVYEEKEAVRISLQVAMWKKHINLMEEAKPLDVMNNMSRGPRRTWNGLHVPVKKTIALLRSFKVSKCYITFDTGDMPLNGQLYPLFSLFSMATGREIMINFWDETTVILTIENNLARLLWTYLRN